MTSVAAEGIEAQAGLWQPSWVVALVRSSVVSMLSLVCTLGCGEDVFSGLQVWRVTPALEMSLDASQCSSVISDDGFGTSVSSAPAFASPDGGRPDFWFEESTSEDGVTFKFGSGSSTRENKLYRNLFFETGKLDRFVVKGQTGTSYVVSVWGSSECDNCAPGTKATGGGEDQMCGAAEALELVATARHGT